MSLSKTAFVTIKWPIDASNSSSKLQLFLNFQIRRSDLDGKNKEFVIQGKARHMAIDGLQGRLYWVTMNTMEAAYLNGDDHIVYFSVPYFCGKHVISLTLNFDLRKVLWYVKSFERQELFMSDLLGNGITKDQLSVQPLGSFISVSP